MFSSRIPLEFYHLVPKNFKYKDRLCSLEYFYRYDKDLYYKYSYKYRKRIIHGWNIYPDIIDPNSLTLEQVHEAINIFREDPIDGNNRIYFFKYLPFKDLGPNMEKVLEDKIAYKIDIEDSKVRLYIKSKIDWGYWMSNTKNTKLSRHYYRSVSEEEYFKYYNDNDVPLFSSLNHIGVIPRSLCIPINILEEVEII